MNRVKKALPLFFILAMLILATSLYSLSQIDIKTYQKNTDLIRNINEQASLLKEAIILVAEGDSADYDHVTHVKHSLVELTQKLALDKYESIVLNRSISDLFTKIEYIKRYHATYQNSLLFFPEATRQIHALLKHKQPGTDLSDLLIALEHNILLFIISPDFLYQSRLQQSIQSIKNHSGTVDLESEIKLQLDLLLKHVEIIITHRQKLNGLFSNTLNSPIAQQTHALLMRYTVAFEASLSKAASIKQAFYISTLFLIISVILVLARLKNTLSSLHKKERSLRLAAKVFENSPEGIVLSDANNKIIQVNAAFTQMTGYTETDVIGKNPSLLSSGQQNSDFYTNMWQIIHSQGQWSGEIINRRKNGETYPEHLSIISIKDDKDRLTHHIGIFSDLSDKKKTEQHIHFLAHYDPLTHLANRTLFTERLQRAILKSQRSKKSIALLFIDLDRFKEINDSFGHKAGDQLLIQVANDIKKCIRETDNAARLGGDEFIITLEELTHKELTLTAPAVAEKILSALTREYSLELNHAYIGASIGIAIYPEDALTADSLLQSADMAMYHAKELGKNNYQFYSNKLNEKAKRRAYIERELRQALTRKQLFLHYQPQYNITSKNIESLEALIRWQHPELGLVSPEDFISIAEESGLIIEIGRWVLETAIDQLLLWQKNINPQLSIAVNVSVKQLESDTFFQFIQTTLIHSKLPPASLEIEITENIFVDDDSITLITLRQLNDYGVQLSMDDFGTGYSNMSYLKKLPIGRIKIDRCFISDIPQDSNDEAIARAIISIAQHFNFNTIAEGVETKEQETFLLTNGCFTGQGFLFSKPLSAEAATQLLIENQKARQTK